MQRATRNEPVRVLRRHCRYLRKISERFLKGQLYRFSGEVGRRPLGYPRGDSISTWTRHICVPFCPFFFYLPYVRDAGIRSPVETVTTRSESWRTTFTL